MRRGRVVEKTVFGLAVGVFVANFALSFVGWDIPAVLTRATQRKPSEASRCERTADAFDAERAEKELGFRPNEPTLENMRANLWTYCMERMGWSCPPGSDVPGVIPESCSNKGREVEHPWELQPVD